MSELTLVLLPEVDVATLLELICGLGRATYVGRDNCSSFGTCHLYNISVTSTSVMLIRGALRVCVLIYSNRFRYRYHCVLINYFWSHILNIVIISYII